MTRIKVGAEQDRISLSGTVSSETSSEMAGKLASLYGKNIVNAYACTLAAHSAGEAKSTQMVEVDRSKLDQLGFNFFSLGTNTEQHIYWAIYSQLFLVASSSGAGGGYRSAPER